MPRPADFLWPEEDLYPGDDDTPTGASVSIRSTRASEIVARRKLDDDVILRLIANIMRII